jgi:hypothetical protein
MSHEPYPPVLGQGSSRGRESDPGPAPYHGAALPLSYTGKNYLRFFFCLRRKALVCFRIQLSSCPELPVLRGAHKFSLAVDEQHDHFIGFCYLTVSFLQLRESFAC